MNLAEQEFAYRNAENTRWLLHLKKQDRSVPEGVDAVDSIRYIVRNLRAAIVDELTCESIVSNRRVASLENLLATIVGRIHEHGRDAFIDDLVVRTRD